MSQITIRQSNKLPYFFINGTLHPEVIRVIDRELSYEVEGYEHSTSYQKGEWDGKNHLLKRTKRGDYYFPVGLIDRVKIVLDNYGIEYEVLEAEHKYKALGLEWHGYQLRDYQMETVVKALSAGRGVIALPTGAGKTVVALKIIHAIDRPTLITVHTKELFRQWENAITKTFRMKAGMIGDGVYDPRPVTVAMLQTATRIRDELPDYDVWVADEVHHIPAMEFWKVATAINAVYRYGLSATPRREDGADLAIIAGTGEMVANITPEYLIEKGWLAKPKFVLVDVPSIRLPRNWIKAYSEGIVRNEVRNKLIVDVAKKLVGEGLQTYVHVERIVHGKILSEKLNCPFICGKDSTKRRKKVIEDFNSGNLRLLVSTLLGEGVDIPGLNAIVLAHGLKSSTMFIQRVGRSLRPSEGKNEAIIVDFVDKGPFLAKHFENRFRTAKKYYSKFFNPVYIRDVKELVL